MTSRRRATQPRDALGRYPEGNPNRWEVSLKVLTNNLGQRRYVPGIRKGRDYQWWVNSEYSIGNMWTTGSPTIHQMTSYKSQRRAERKAKRRIKLLNKNSWKEDWREAAS